MKAFILIYTSILVFFIPTAYATDCSEWATMSQVLVVRWQKDTAFQNRTLPDVKAELSKVMAKNPDLPSALFYVDTAYTLRKENPQDVWKKVYGMCRSGVDL